ncbi:ABC-type amino acid transport substrate-binding protein [Marinitoga hydrogenitolerans DSM 16785]|uniref:ABC-type amino acid transport substrate-binding protein n=1 Tax=Marinitoga hydrogenitolerans (strain DSM 16785 / JCM 12826 / AT1271) TaxID=1122195 RepID=A0A1M4Z0D5_MARH1|nr:transporter substrate-binding domain-containing protein [Marinitoga hydrogenitolerans]SHF11212.1 ABC-type amino acid transport substrate-binding protein [Marinitoga hydrogenitolerans DSM 16785]
MKKLSLALIILILSTTVTAISLTVGVYDNKPLSYIEDGEYKGFAVDLIKQIAEEENWSLTFQYDTFTNLMKKIQNSNIDMIIVLGKTKKRELFIKYPSEPFFTNWGVIYSNNHNIDSILDLKNKKVAVLKDDIYFISENGIKRLSEKMNLNIKFYEFNSYSDVINAVKKHICDAGVVNRIYNVNTNDVYKTPVVFLPIEIFFGFSKNISNSIIHRIDSNLNKWKNDNSSIYYTLFQKYIFKESFIPYWIKNTLKITFIVIMVLSINSAIFYFLLKKSTKTLKKKNQELDAYNNELNAINEELEESYNNIENLNFKLIQLIKTMSKLRISSSFDEFYEELLRTAIYLIPEADYGSIIYINSSKNYWKFLSAYGHNFKLLKNISYAAGHVPLEEKIKIVNNNIIENEKIEMDEESYNLLKEASKPIKETMIYEIKLKENQWINFCLDIDKNSNKNFSEESKELLRVFANLARAFWNQKIFYENIKESYINLANKLAFIAEEYDDITGEHIYRVAKYSKFIAEKLNLNKELIEKIYLYAPLHDIGKILVDKSMALSKVT